VSRPLRIGIALGGGAARGWAHIGVLQALAREGVVPAVVAGTSIGALVGATFAADRLGALEDWVRSLKGLDVLRLLDTRLAGGVIQGDRVMQVVEGMLPDLAIEQLPRPYAAVATDLRSGRPVWLRSGSIIDAVRASCAMPGLMSPRRHERTWLVDGGLVDPVPVTLCRVLGADVVIAVDLTAYRHRRRAERVQATERSVPVAASPAEEQPGAAPGANDLRAYVDRLQSLVGDWFDFGGTEAPREPGLLDVVAASIDIMQQNITRSRLAGDPPELELTPELAGIGLLEFHKAADAIAAGIRAVEERAAELARLAV
jgi:NTE family protein